ncbi:MAG: RluA family pseudouridine synthase [Bacteroidetes bacterium]|nr:RluA family pseudouridine synthase [Bacteroidota bacterium]
MEFKEIKKRILFEDNHILIFNKPAGLPVQGDKTGDECLLDVVKDFIKERDAKPGNVYLGLVHRLDRPVSGLVVLAKTSKALSRLTEMFRDRQVRKIYHAIVNGIPSADAATLTHYHRKDGEKRIAILSNSPKSNTKPAVLHYQLLKHFAGNSLLEIELETGRFHQIRAQLFKNGNYIIGDLKYGAKKPNQDKSIYLHARSIEFEHPVTKKTIKTKAPYPKNQLWEHFG